MVTAGHVISSGRVGCPHFMAPEVIQRRQYGKPGDVWSAGVLLHILLTGTVPFVGSGERLRDAICRGRVQVCSNALDTKPYEICRYIYYLFTLNILIYYYRWSLQFGIISARQQKILYRRCLQQK